ncbi:MAG: hypothetical protein ACOC14_01880 [Bacillota bacterium]
MSMMRKVLLTLSSWAGTIVMGVVVSSLGRPYHGLVFSVHILLALAAVGMTFVFIRTYFKEFEPDTLTTFLLVVIGVAVIALFMTGTFLSIGFGAHETVKSIHTITTVILALSAAGVFVLTQLKSR